MLNRLHIENFTVFRKADFEFVPGINVLVGANASGKTHLLKLLYALQKSQTESGFSSSRRDIADFVLDVFRPERLDDLVRRKSTNRATVKAWWNESPVEFGIRTAPAGGHPIESFTTWKNVSIPIFIPVKDMLAHSVGFLSLYDTRNIDFDLTYRDILSLAFTPTLRESERASINPQLMLLEELLGGRVELKGERFYLSGKTGKFEMHMVAEGWRKMVLLYQLIANGSLGPSNVLYWDEPETNLNPSLMDELIGILYALARNGTQIFLATHSYIILKELELQKTKQDSLRLFAMERSKRGGSVTPHVADAYNELTPNLIADQFERIYDLEIKRVIGGSNG